MPIYVALLRGINVGKAKRIAMADLRSLLGGLGYTDVVTLLNSGNAIFSAPKGSAASHAAVISKQIAAELGLEVPVLVKTSKELALSISECPFSIIEADHSRFIVAFAQDKMGLEAVKAIESLIEPDELFALGRSAAYLYCASGILESKAGKALLGKVGKGVTTRNWATVLKLREMCGDA
jgi:uncharacterized protein (DUF1697 family)